MYDNQTLNLGDKGKFSKPKKEKKNYTVVCDIFILCHLQLVGFPYPWQTIHRLSLEKYELGFDFKTNQLILTLHLSMLPLDTEQRPIPTFHLGAKKDTIWHCSKPDRKKKCTVHVD